MNSIEHYLNENRNNMAVSFKIDDFVPLTTEFKKDYKGNIIRWVSGKDTNAVWVDDTKAAVKLLTKLGATDISVGEASTKMQTRAERQER